MYQVFLKKIKQQTFVVIVFVAIIFCLSYINTNSILISIFVALVGFFVWYFLSGGGLKKRRKFVKSLCLRFDRMEEYPLLDEKKNPGIWKKGIGVTDDMNQPMWVRTDNKGIVLYYLCFARKRPFIIPWDGLSQISLKRGSIGRESDLFARLYIPGIGMKIYIPWDNRFNKAVPDHIAFVLVNE